MTAQIGDTFRFQGEEYALIGIAGGELFSPQQYGMEPGMIHTACYRGFYATYEIADSGIFLQQLTIREEHGNYRPINGVVGEKQDFQAVYRNVYLPVPFTGKLRLAIDLIEELHIHMGFQKPTAFQTVYDLEFEHGRLAEVRDRAKEMEEKRGAFKKRFEEDNMFRGIEEAFSLDMNLE